MTVIKRVRVETKKEWRSGNQEGMEDEEEENQENHGPRRKRRREEVVEVKRGKNVAKVGNHF